MRFWSTVLEPQLRVWSLCRRCIMRKINRFSRATKALILRLVLISGLTFIPSCMSQQLELDAPLLHKLFYSDSNCNAPCWQNLSPGSSTIEDVEQLVFNASEQELHSYQRTEIEPDFVRYSWYNEIEGLFVNISVFRGIVDYIRFTPMVGERGLLEVASLATPPQDMDEDTKYNQPVQNNSTYAYKFADILRFIGEPSQYSALISTDFHGTKLLSIILFYQNGIIVDSVYFEGQQDDIDFESLDGCVVKISPDLPVQRLFFTNLTTLTDTVPGSGSRLSLFNGDVYSWDGLDNIHLSKCND